MRLLAVICFLLFLIQIEKIKSHPREIAKKIVNYSVPKGVTVDFYVKYGEILPVAKAEKIWQELII